MIVDKGDSLAVNTLLRPPIDALTFQDVRDFCAQQVKEHLRLEYKQEFSSKSPGRQISKAVSALANTHGGVVIWGVKELEDVEGVAHATQHGMPLGGNPRSAVLSSCDDHIFPPLAVEASEFLKNPDDPSLGFVVVRVPASEDVHTVENGAGIYRRVADQSKPVRADLDMIEHLLRRRRAAASFQEERRTRANQQIRFALDNKIGKGSIWISVGPRVGFASLISLTDLQNRWRELSVPSQYTSRRTPVDQPVHGVLDGLYYVDELREQGGLLDVFGNITVYADFAQPMKPSRWLYGSDEEWGALPQDDKGFMQCMNGPLILERLFATLAAAKNLYSELGFIGVLQLTIQACGVHRMPLVVPGRIGLVGLSVCMTDDTLVISESLSVSDLDDQSRLDEFMLSATSRLLSAWGCRSAEASSLIVDAGEELFYGARQCESCNGRTATTWSACRKCRATSAQVLS